MEDRTPVILTGIALPPGTGFNISFRRHFWRDPSVPLPRFLKVREVTVTCDVWIAPDELARLRRVIWARRRRQRRMILAFLLLRRWRMIVLSN